MAFIRLLQRRPDGDIVFREATSGDVPAYAILSHTWGKEEVIFQDMEADVDRSKTASKAGWEKIQFCAEQAAADGLQYFWIDTCCIDKRNAVELSAAINSMFRWYQNAARCYAYLSDVPDDRGEDDRAWKETFRSSRWFRRGWTLQELIAPRLVGFFSSEGTWLGNKLTLESDIYKTTGISRLALRGDRLSSFSIQERKSWAERRHTTVEEDRVYCLLGIFEVSMVLNYGEGQSRAYQRLEEEIHKLYKGVDYQQFAIEPSLASIPEAVQFVSREKELLEMHELLYGHSNRSVIVLYGLGGIGKTQLAREYIKRHQEKYTAIFWLNTNDYDSLRLSFRTIAQRILKHHPLTKELSSVYLQGDLDQVVDAVRTWLDLPENTHWLLIYDNYDNPRTPTNQGRSTIDISPLLPASDHGSIVITTRSASVRKGRRLHIQKLKGIKDGLEILSNTSGRIGLEHDHDAKALVTKLDGLPLALSTAGAYLEQVTMSFAQYLWHYEAEWLKLQETSPQLSSYEDRSLYTTWQVTFDRIKNQNAASAQLLKLWAYFDKQDIWFELLRNMRSTEDKNIKKLIEDELSFTKAVRLLCEYGLVQIEPLLSKSSSYSVHSCVHAWTIFVLNNEWDDNLARLALNCVADEIPNTNVDEWWLLQRRLLQHAARQSKFITGGNLNLKGMERMLHNLGNLYNDQGKLADAEAMYTRALQGYEEALGAKHTSTLNTVNNLGTLYNDQGKLADAEAMYTRALQGYEEALGAKHTSTLNTVSNLGTLFKAQGKLADAEAMYTRALQGYREALGLQLLRIRYGD